jgi:HTH-type transcriptional regulator, competence development regulator
VATPTRGQPGFGRYLKEARTKLGYSLRKVEGLTDGRVRNAFLSQIENGQVSLPNVELLGDLAALYGLDFWDTLTRAGYRLPKNLPVMHAYRRETNEWYPVRVDQLKDLTSEELSELLKYADFIRMRRRPRQRRNASA